MFPAATRAEPANYHGSGSCNGVDRDFRCSFALGSHAKARLQARRQFLALGAVASRAVLVLYPSFVKAFHWQSTEWVKCQHCMSSFKSSLNILIASLAEEANNLPTFFKSVDFGRQEICNSYQVSYYRQFRQRTIDLIRAQYSPDLAQVQNSGHME